METKKEEATIPTCVSVFFVDQAFWFELHSHRKHELVNMLSYLPSPFYFISKMQQICT